MSQSTENQRAGGSSVGSSCNSVFLASPYKEIYYLGLGSQSNIYCTCKLIDPERELQKLFVASLRGKVSCVESCQKSGSNAQPQSNEVYFTYIPGDAEIISINGFCKSRYSSGARRCEFVIGITLVLIKSQHGDLGTQHFFNIYIYNSDEPSNALFDKTTQICQHKLNFTPYQLISTRFYNNVKDCYKVAFLLSGSDGKIHMFRETRGGYLFIEQPCEDFFPEFSNLPSNVTWMDIKYCRNDLRVSAVGCQNGNFRVLLVDVKTAAILNVWSCDLDGPISSVKLFTLHADQKTQDDLGEPVNPELLCSAADLNLLVTSALEVATVYLQVAENGLSKMVILPRSDNFDSVTCSLVFDEDHDGANEILLGTYGQELLAYKWHQPTEGFEDTIHFDLQWSRSFSKPLFAIESIDLLNNGFSEIAITSMAGVHILQHDVQQMADLALSRLEEYVAVAEDCTQKENSSSEAVNE